MTRTAITLVLGITLAGVATTNAAAQTATAGRAAQPAARAADNPWEPWAGCWMLMEETTDDGSSTIARLLGLPAPRTKGADQARVCVTLDTPGQATMATTMSDQPVMTETIVADGTERALADSECRGWQKAEWSTLGPRLFATAEMTCGSQAPRKVSGLSMMIAGPTWLDIQMIEGGGQKNLRVRKYRRVAETGVARRPATAPRPLLSRLSVADVKEASAKVAPEALQAALIELKGGFDLKAKTLVELADAGVTPGVIDLMVALSFPQKFVVDRQERGGGGGGGGGGGSWGFDSFDEWSFWTNPYLMASYYAPFGYRYWGGYGNYYYNGPGFVVINPPGGTGGGGEPEPSGDGRVVDGRGYTRVRRVEPQPVDGGNRSTGGSSTASSTGSSSGSTGSSGVSSSGYSSGGSSGSTGSSGGGERTAQPRPPGGN